MKKLYTPFVPFFFSASLALCAFFACAVLPAAALAAAAPNVEPSVTLHGAAGGVLSNGVITADWQIHDGHLTGLTVRPARASAENPPLHIDGPFTLALNKIGVLPAADLTLSGQPQIEHLVPDPAAARAAEHFPGIAVHYTLADPQNRFDAVWSLVLLQGSNYVRQTLTITTHDAPLPLSEVVLIDTHSPKLELTGTVSGSPLVAGNYFLGFESPLSDSSVVNHRGVCELESAVPLGADHTATYSAVVGIAAPGQMRRDFLAYIERERAHPYRTFLHYNSWFDIGFFTPYTQADALNRIHAIGEELHVKRGVTLDSYLFDDGWDDHNNLWQIRPDFKDGFTPLTQAAAEYGTAPGIWLSPWGGYGKPKDERVATAKRDGYKLEGGLLALSGPKYYALFHDAVINLVKKYDINQFKFDGTGNADQVIKGSPFSSDFDAAIHLITDLRKLKPSIYINLTTGTYPSPFWLRYADSIWRGGYDTNFAGVGTKREQWITYRDADTYAGIVKQGSLFPLNSLMLHGIVYAQKAPGLSTDPGNDFRNEVHDYFGTGTQLQEMYITPSLLTKANWDDLAEAAKWSRRNAQVLKDTHWVGGDPKMLEVYGWAAWTPQKAILTLRNPSDKAQDFTLDIGPAFELPAGAARRYTAHSPWASDAGQPATSLVAGAPHTFHLAPFEVLNLDVTPQK